jgi:TolB protein
MAKGMNSKMGSMGRTAACCLVLAALLAAAGPAGAAFSGGSGRVAFYRDGDWDIYVMKLAPEGPRNVPVKLTKNAASDAAPDWAPDDGTQLVFNSNRSGNSEVYRMKASPEGRLNKPVNLSKNPAGDYAPTWSPDGRKIAFTSERPGSDGTTDWEIWRMRATDGANPTNLTDNTAI